MKLHELFRLQELRRQPSLNPKTPINDRVIDYLAKHPDLMVSFTRLEKLGVNPRSPHDSTPLGIYAYPASYVVKTVGRERGMDELPYAGGEPWANLFTCTGRVIDLGDLTEDSVDRLVVPLDEIMESAMPSYGDGRHQNIDDIYFYARNSAKTPAGVWWALIEEVAREIAGTRGAPVPMIWNWVFRQLGIDGVIDPDLGIIYDGEPTQAVFFSRKSLSIVGRYHNKYSPAQVDKRSRRGSQRDQSLRNYGPELRRVADYDRALLILDKMGTDATLEYIADRDLRLRLLKARPGLLDSLRQPTAEEQMVVLKELTDVETPGVNLTLNALRIIGILKMPARLAAYSVNRCGGGMPSTQVAAAVLDQYMRSGKTQMAIQFLDRVDHLPEIYRLMTDYNRMVKDYMSRLQPSVIKA